MKQDFYGAVKQVAARDIVNIGVPAPTNGGRCLAELTSDELRTLRADQQRAMRTLQRALLLNAPMGLLLAMLPVPMLLLVLTFDRLGSGAGNPAWASFVWSGCVLALLLWFKRISAGKVSEIELIRKRIHAIDRVLCDRID